MPPGLSNRRPARNRAPNASSAIQAIDKKKKPIWACSLELLRFPPRSVASKVRKKGARKQPTPLRAPQIQGLPPRPRAKEAMSTVATLIKTISNRMGPGNQQKVFRMSEEIQSERARRNELKEKNTKSRATAMETAISQCAMSRDHARKAIFSQPNARIANNAPTAS